MAGYCQSNLELVLLGQMCPESDKRPTLWHHCSCEKKGSFWSCHHSCQATATKSGITFPQTLIVDKTSLSTVPITTQLQCLADMEVFDNMLLLCNRGFQNCWQY